MPLVFVLALLAAPAHQLTPAASTAQVNPLGGGWSAVDGLIARGDVVSVLRFAPDGTLWVGTRGGRLLHESDDGWRCEVALAGLQITDLAFDDGVWLATSDGIVRLEAVDGGWSLRHDRTFYLGPPAFVSGAYMPGDDAERMWGYVDAIAMPRVVGAYAPYVCSRQYGLFSSANRYGVWHHYLPHYWGANSPWLDLRELLPRRRATCLTEDGLGNLWVGSEGDGLFCFRAAGRRLHERGDADNAPDAAVFARFGIAEVGGDFRFVRRLAAAADGAEVLALFEQDDGARFLRLGTDERWEELPLDDAPGYLEDAAIDAEGNILVAGQRGLWQLDLGGTMSRLVPVAEQVIRVVAGERAACATREAVYLRE